MTTAQTGKGPPLPEVVLRFVSQYTLRSKCEKFFSLYLLVS